MSSRFPGDTHLRSSVGRSRDHLSTIALWPESRGSRPGDNHLSCDHPGTTTGGRQPPGDNHLSCRRRTLGEGGFREQHRLPLCALRGQPPCSSGPGTMGAGDNHLFHNRLLGTATLVIVFRIAIPSNTALGRHYREPDVLLLEVSMPLEAVKALRAGESGSTALSGQR